MNLRANLCIVARMVRIVRRVAASMVFLACAVALIAPATAAPALIRAPEAQITDAWVARSYTLLDLGISAPVATHYRDAYQEFYLPVPAGVPLKSATIRFHANYLLGDGSSATLQLLVDGEPVLARTLTDPKGELDLTLPLGTQPRAGGFVRLGINWLETRVQMACEVALPSVNTLSVWNTTGIAYHYKADASLTLESAWNSLPGKPVILVSDTDMDAESFDTAWRLAVALERSGKRVTVRPFPKVNDLIDVHDLSVPDALRNIPVFAALNGGAHRVISQAQIGALLMLGSSAVLGDIAVLDAPLARNIEQALDALERSPGIDANTVKVLQEWRRVHVRLFGDSEIKQHIGLVSFGPRPVIAVGSGAGSEAAGLFGGMWRALLKTRNVTVERAIDPEVDDRSAIRLSSLGGSVAAFDVVNQGDWLSSFPLRSVAFNGGMPDTLVLDVAVAPDASNASPVLSVFLNDTLLAASKMKANGVSERIRARIPGYALRLDNTLRVTLQRLPASGGCADPPRGYPMNILPTSYLKTGKAQPDGTFVGLLPLFASSPELIIPESWLSAGPVHIVQIARLAVASGFSATDAKLVLAPPESTVTPGGAFLSMGVPLTGVNAKVQIGPDQRLVIKGRRVPWLDITGLTALSAAEVVASGKQNGILWHSVGAQAATLQQPYMLHRGDVAIVDASGIIAWIDSSNPDSSGIADAASTAFYEWRHYFTWGVPLASGALLLFAVLLALAYRAGRKRRAGKRQR